MWNYFYTLSCIYMVKENRYVFFTFGGKLILYDYESIPLASNTRWAFVRPRLLASNSSIYTTTNQHGVSKIKRNETQIRSDAQRNKQPDRKRARERTGVDVETAILCWFRQMRGEKVPLNGPMLLEKAHSLAIELNSDFQPNPSWLERLKKRENVPFQKLRRETGG